VSGVSAPFDVQLAEHEPAAARRGPAVPALFHWLALLWVAAMLALAYASPEQYGALLQEDRAVEWGTVWLFAAAGVIHLRQAVRARGLFDILVGLFCIFVAGEEFSWGQRLLGLEAPDYFLAHNFQQEINLHNLPGAYVKPKWILILALAGYGILLPAVARLAPARRLLARLGATAPPLQLTPWFVAAIGLLLWYPFTLTGEWVEFLAGGLFLASRKLTQGTLWIVLSLSLIFGVGMMKATGAIERERDTGRATCAAAEAQALLDDLTGGGAATDRLRGRRLIHRRVWTAMNRELIDRGRTPKFDSAPCADAAGGAAADRRRYAVDPWGMSYWIHVQQGEGGEQRVVIYSFGPNRRRDGEAGLPDADDIGAIGTLGPARE
jgi:hypothetical protein